MIIETNQYRQLLEAELGLFEQTLAIARVNRRYSVKSACMVVQQRPSGLQIVCGTFASHRATKVQEEYTTHPEFSVMDLIPYDNVDRLTLYIARTNMENEPIASRPCKKCMKEIDGITEIVDMVYMSDDMRILKEVLRGSN